MSSSPKVSVVIVNWNTRTYLFRALAPLAGRHSQGSLPTVVVDNASSDGSPDAVAQSHPAVHLIRNTTNRGYAAAINQGVATADTPYILIANADVEMTPDTIHQLADWMDQHPAIGIVGPRLMNPAGTLQLSWGHDPHLWSEMLQRWWWRSLEAMPGQRLLRHLARSPHQVDWVLGACFMIRRQTYVTLGGMDEQYFMYFEEVDLCTRFRKAGWQVWYVPTAAAIHHGCASTSQTASAMRAAYRRSQLRYYRRFHGPMAAALLTGYLWFKYGWRRAGRQMLRTLT